MTDSDNKTKQGTLIVFEGIDGSGKSTQAERSFNRLKNLGFPLCFFREPTDSIYGKIIRKILSGKIPRRTPEEELYLFLRDREEDVAQNIRPAMARGEIVLLDRYYYSTMAYQGAMGIDIEKIRAQNERFAPLADLVLVFLVSVEKGLARIREERAEQIDHYEKEDFLTHVDRIFRSFKDPQIRYIDAERPLKEVGAEVDRIIDLFLSENGWRCNDKTDRKENIDIEKMDHLSRF